MTPEEKQAQENSVIFCRQIIGAFLGGLITICDVATIRKGFAWWFSREAEPGWKAMEQTRAMAMGEMCPVCSQPGHQANECPKNPLRESKIITPFGKN